MRRPARRLTVSLPVLLSVAVALVVAAGDDEQTSPRRVDPAAWGGDHVGKPLPMYVTGDECLFCHRDIGNTWGENPHQLTIRPASPDDPALATLSQNEKGKSFAAEVRFLLGTRRRVRFLKRSKDYGKLEMLCASFVPASGERSAAKEKPPPREAGRLTNVESLAWGKAVFGDRCAGCHTTAVNPKTRAFSSLSLDCFTCHGDVPLEHTKDTSLVLLSSRNRQSRAIVSLCGQCHLRGGKSKSSELPYPNAFVAGDNLFRDYQVDFSDKAIEALPAIEQHLWLNARDVAVFDQRATNCLSCHDVHKPGTAKHQELRDATICASCHVPGKDKSNLRDEIVASQRRRTHSPVCDY